MSAGYTKHKALKFCTLRLPTSAAFYQMHLTFPPPHPIVRLYVRQTLKNCKSALNLARTTGHLADPSPHQQELQDTTTGNPTPAPPPPTVCDTANAFGSCIFKCAWKYPCSSCEYFVVGRVFVIVFQTPAYCMFLLRSARKMFNWRRGPTTIASSFFTARLLLLTRCDLARNKLILWEEWEAGGKWQGGFLRKSNYLWRFNRKI